MLIANGCLIDCFVDAFTKTQRRFFIMSGEGTVIIDGEPHPVRAGDVVRTVASHMQRHQQATLR